VGDIGIYAIYPAADAFYIYKTAEPRVDAMGQSTFPGYDVSSMGRLQNDSLSLYDDV
jgi:hypothetical protein